MASPRSGFYSGGVSPGAEQQLQDGSFQFLAIFLEGLPFIFLGTLVSGFLGTYLPRDAFEKALPKNRSAAILVSGLLGLVFPVCECAVVPVIRRMVKQGLPASCALAYMLAAPIVNPVTLLSTYKAFNSWPMAGSRLVMGYLIAVIVALAMARVVHSKWLRKSALAHEHDHSHPRSLTAAMHNSLKDLMDVGIYFTIGVVLTALLKTTLIDPSSDFWQGLAANDLLASSAMMTLAFVLSLCSTSDAFIAANLASFTVAPQLAFMVFGPMMDAKLIFLYSTVFRWKFIAALAVALFFLTGAFALFFEWNLATNWGPETAPLVDPR